MRVEHGSARGIGPQIVADEPADCDSFQLESPQRADTVTADLAFSLCGHGSGCQGLAVETEEFPVRVVETDLVVALAVIGLDKARTQRQRQTFGTGSGNQFRDTRLHLGLIERGCVAA